MPLPVNLLKTPVISNAHNNGTVQNRAAVGIPPRYVSIRGVASDYTTQQQVWASGTAVLTRLIGKRGGDPEQVEHITVCGEDGRIVYVCPVCCYFPTRRSVGRTFSDGTPSEYFIEIFSKDLIQFFRRHCRTDDHVEAFMRLRRIMNDPTVTFQPRYICPSAACQKTYSQSYSAKAHFDRTHPTEAYSKPVCIRVDVSTIFGDEDIPNIPDEVAGPADDRNSENDSEVINETLEITPEPVAEEVIADSEHEYDTESESEESYNSDSESDDPSAVTSNSHSQIAHGDSEDEDENDAFLQAYPQSFPLFNSRYRVIEVEPVNTDNDGFSTDQSDGDFHRLNTLERVTLETQAYLETTLRSGTTGPSSPRSRTTRIFKHYYFSRPQVEARGAGTMLSALVPPEQESRVRPGSSSDPDNWYTTSEDSSMSDATTTPYTSEYENDISVPQDDSYTNLPSRFERMSL
ncbi:hypothetical protein BXZ70DRAFT_235464 [Cristinia sonorae]|uniref:C2H2-type domain-containing protein n=1 Tax=Cristinia sonorae TaxID=1940300 RepID=A0A8K0ULS6_9AGAR|nr:hypothetical protein BXZ70DRAFT_235464 [Cristinia sonorae]